MNLNPALNTEILTLPNLLKNYGASSRITAYTHADHANPGPEVLDFRRTPFIWEVTMALVSVFKPPQSPSLPDRAR